MKVYMPLNKEINPKSNLSKGNRFNIERHCLKNNHDVPCYYLRIHLKWFSYWNVMLIVLVDLVSLPNISKNEIEEQTKYSILGGLPV